MEIKWAEDRAIAGTSTGVSYGSSPTAPAMNIGPLYDAGWLAAKAHYEPIIERLRAVAKATDDIIGKPYYYAPLAAALDALEPGDLA